MKVRLSLSLYLPACEQCSSHARAGDGIVLYSSASSLPGGPDRWNKHLKGVVESSFGHVSLVGDVENIRKCLVELYD